MTETEDRAAPRAQALRSAARESGVVWAGMLSLGIGFGVLVTDHGLPWWLAPVISGAMFAGSVEFILIGMLAVSAPIASIAVTTLLINSRHLFYGLTFPLHRVRGRPGKAYSVFALCDEAFALLATKSAETLSSARMLWTQAGMHLSWAGGSLIGGLLGASVLSGVEGLDFVLTALFLVLTLDAYADQPDKATLASAVGAGVVALVLAPGSMLLVAMTVFTIGLVIRHLVGARRA